jgi:hypothetical protein
VHFKAQSLSPSIEDSLIHVHILVVYASGRVLSIIGAVIFMYVACVSLATIIRLTTPGRCCRQRLPTLTLGDAPPLVLRNSSPLCE